MWAAMLRGGACYGDLHDYFVKVVFSYGAAYTPEDTYTSVRFGLAEAVDAGSRACTPGSTTSRPRPTRGRRSRRCGSPGCAAASRTGRRAIPRLKLVRKGSETLDFDDILRLRDEEFASARADPPRHRLPGHEFSREHIWKKEFAWGREHGLPITAHCMMTATISRTVARFDLPPGGRPRPGSPARPLHPGQRGGDPLARRHLDAGLDLDPVGAAVRHGHPADAGDDAGGVAVSLSLDTMAASDNSDMFNAMRITMGIERARPTTARSTSRAGAAPGHVRGRGDPRAERVGQLREGWRADVILLRADDLNMAPTQRPRRPGRARRTAANVDTVFIDGVLRKRHGEMIGVDRRALVDDVTQAMADLNARVGVRRCTDSQRKSPAAA